MARRAEGTTLSGYKCDHVGCDENGAYAPCALVPFEGWSEKVRKPIICMFDAQVCRWHVKDVRLDDMLTKAAKTQIREIADAAGGKPAWERARVVFTPCNSGEYLEFQQKTGLVPPDDAMVKGPPLILP
jgi:hypothetical protein